MAITVDRAATVPIKEAEDEDPEMFHLEPEAVHAIFELADKLDHFKRTLESGLKVANIGAQNLSLGKRRAKPARPNSIIRRTKTPRLLQDWFERISESERALMNLSRADAS